MSMTQLQIVNMALAELGQNVITQTQLTADLIPAARFANLFWQPCRDEVLGESNWPFATVTESLSALDITDVEWSYCYSYPTMTVSAIWKVFNEATTTTKDKQEFGVKHISTLGVSALFTDLDYAIAEYTYKVTDTSLWSNKFCMAFAYRLAAMMAMPLLGDSEKGLQLMDIYNVILGESKRLNSSERRKVPYDDSKYINSR